MPSTSTGKRNRQAPGYYGFERTVLSVSELEPVPASKKQETTNPVIETVIYECATQPPVNETGFELPVVSPSNPRVRPLSSFRPDYDYAYYEREVSMSVFDAENQI